MPICKKRKKQEYINKNNNIISACKALEKGRITAALFLNRIVSVLEMNFDEIGETSDDNDFEEAINEEILNFNGNSSDDNKSLCVICQEKPPNVVFIPCKHLKTCSECIEQLINYNNQNNAVQDLLCPFCRKLVEQKIQVFV